MTAHQQQHLDTFAAALTFAGLKVVAAIKTAVVSVAVEIVAAVVEIVVGRKIVADAEVAADQTSFVADDDAGGFHQPFVES